MSVPRPTIQAVGGVPSSNYGGKRPTPTHITLHHIVGDAPAAIARFRQQSGVSATFVIGSDGTIYQMLPIDTIPYTDGNYTSNKRAITIEHAGGHPSVPYTTAMYNSSIALTAWLRQEYGIPESNMLLHRDVIDRTAYPGGTACPGSLDTERIKTESSKLLNGEIPMNEGDVFNMYVALLGRQPDPAGKATYVGKPWHDVFYSITHSDEYAKRQEAAATQATTVAEQNQLLDEYRAKLEAANKNATAVLAKAEKTAPASTKAKWYQPIADFLKGLSSRDVKDK